MDIRRNRSFCRVLRNRFFWSALIIICSVSVWVWGCGYQVCNNSTLPRLLGATIVGILLCIASQDPLVPKAECRSKHTLKDFLRYVILLVLTWGLVFYFLIGDSPENPRLSKMTALIIAGSYLGTVFSLSEYNTNKNSNIIPTGATTFFCMCSILLEVVLSSNTTCFPAIDLYSIILFFGAPFWYFLCLPSTQAKQDIHAPERYKVDVEMKNERGEEITWAGHANVTPCEQEE